MHKIRAGLKTAAILTTFTLTSLAATQACAQVNSIFPPGWDSNVRDRLFMRLGYTSVFTKTKSEDARDITGPVITARQLRDALFQCANTPTNPDNSTCEIVAGGLVGSDYYTDPQANPNPDAGSFFAVTGLNGIGTPAGVKARAQKNVGTPTVSIGYWVDDDHKWLVEGFVLAAPIKIKIYGDGVRADGVTPNGVNGKELATTKLLPPLVIGSYNFGSKTDRIRPYVGVGVMYAVFFDGKPTEFFNDYQGGKTTITTKNTFGAGPFAGIQTAIDGDWHVNLSLGRVALRSTSRLVTSNTNITSTSAVLRDISATGRSDGSDFPSLVDLGEGANGDGTFTNPGFTTRLMDIVKAQRGSNSLGTYVREQKMKITNTIVTLSVGRSF